MAVKGNKPHGQVECFEAQQEQWSKRAEPGGAQPWLALGLPPPALPRLTLHKPHPAELLILRGDKAKTCNDLFLQQSFTLSLWLQTLKGCLLGRSA